MITQLVVLDVVLLATGVWLVRGLRRDRAIQRPAVSERQPDVTDLDLSLITVGISDDTFVLDGVITEDIPSLGPAGWPVTVRVHRPDGMSLDSLTSSVLARWAAEDAVVHCTFRGDPRQSRVSISDGSSTVHFVA